MADDRNGAGVLLPACRELLDSHPGSLRIRRRFLVPEGRQLIAWGASPRDRDGEETKAPEGRHPARRRVAAPRLPNSLGHRFLGLAPQAIDCRPSGTEKVESK